MPPLFKRLRRRLRGAKAQRANLAPIWSEAEPYAKEAFQNISASFVASWEVATAALYREGSSRWDKEKVTDLVNRFSDGLVPTTDGLSTVEHQLEGSWRLAADDGDSMSERVPRLRTLLKPLGTDTAVGWTKTVAYIRPILEQLDLSADAIDALEALGEALKRGLDDQVETLITKLGGLPEDKLQAELLSTLQSFSDGASRVVEIELDAVTRLIQSDA